VAYPALHCSHPACALVGVSSTTKLQKYIIAGIILCGTVFIFISSVVLGSEEWSIDLAGQVWLSIQKQPKIKPLTSTPQALRLRINRISGHDISVKRLWRSAMGTYNWATGNLVGSEARIVDLVTHQCLYSIPHQEGGNLHWQCILSRSQRKHREWKDQGPNRCHFRQSRRPEHNRCKTEYRD
jgi:hypothetical protein